MFSSLKQGEGRRRWRLPFRTVKSLAAALPLLWILAVPALAERPSAEQVVERALMESAFKGELESVQQLVLAGISVNVSDDQEHMPLMWAAYNGHTQVVAFILEQGAEVNARDQSGRTALMYASSGPFKETVELLLQNGAETNFQDTVEGFTALMTAAAEGQLEIVGLLLAYGANPEHKDKDGDTAESFARAKGHEITADLLQKSPPRTNTYSDSSEF